VKDVLAELEKPGRDPRPEFKTAAFKDGVHEIGDLTPGMILEGVVTNVVNFGAFVDIGVHQDGLVHISQLADRFVKDPREVVKAGDIVKVKVVDVDRPRARIALTMKLQERVGVRTTEPAGAQPGQRGESRSANASASAAPKTSMAAAFANVDASRSSDPRRRPQSNK
jgi:uncharacterized protein